MYFPSIDMKETGAKIYSLIKSYGYDVKFIQEYLHLACPQSVYRWFKGTALPSLDNMYALSVLFGLHMDELIVPKQQKIICQMEQVNINARHQRMLFYYRKINRVA